MTNNIYDGCIVNSFENQQSSVQTENCTIQSCERRNAKACNISESACQQSLSSSIVNIFYHEVEFKDELTEDTGGALSFSRPSTQTEPTHVGFYFLKCSFINCHADKGGGAVYLMNCASVSLLETIFSNCTSSTIGSAAYFSSAKPECKMERCTVKKCECTSGSSISFALSDTSHLPTAIRPPSVIFLQNSWSGCNTKFGSAATEIKYVKPEMLLMNENTVCECSSNTSGAFLLYALVKDWHVPSVMYCFFHSNEDLSRGCASDLSIFAQELISSKPTSNSYSLSKGIRADISNSENRVTHDEWLPAEMQLIYINNLGTSEDSQTCGVSQKSACKHFFNTLENHCAIMPKLIITSDVDAGTNPITIKARNITVYGCNMDVEAKLEDRQWQNAFQDSILDYISVREEERHSIIFRDQKEDSSMKISDARLRFRGLNFVHPPSGVTLFNLAVSGSQFNLEGNTLVIEDSSFTSQMPKQMIQQKAHANEQVHTTTPLLILQCGRATLNSIKVSHFSATESLIYVTENDLNPNLKCSFYCINCLFEDITGCEKANAERANQISEASVMAINYFENIYISNTNFSNCVSGKSEFGGAIKLIGHETYQVCFNSCHVERCKALVSTSHLSNKGKNQASLLLADGHNTIDNEILSTDGKGKGGWMYVQFKPLYPSKLLLTLSQLIFNENDADVGCDIFMLVSNSMFSMSSNIFVDTLNSHIKADNSIIAQSTQDPDKLINLYSQLVPVQLDELHVSSNGEDSIKCGHANLPCYTFSFAVSRGNSRYTYAPEYSMINIILHNNVLIEDPMTVDGISIESEDGTMQQISVKKSEGIDSFWLTTYGKTTFTSLQFIHFSAMKNSNMLLSVMSGTLSINTCNFTQNRIGKLAFDVPLAVINDASIMINDSFIYNIASAANLFVINTSPVNEFQPGQSHMSTIFTNTTFTQIQLTGSSIISLRPYVLSSVLPHSFEVALKGSRVELCKALKAGSPLLANIPEWDVDSPTLTLELTNITHCESPKQAGALVFAERSIVNINSCSFNEITEYKQQNTNIFQAYFFDEPQVACDWSFSSVYLRQCQTSIRYFSYSNVQIGPVAIAGGVLEGTDVSFSRNTLPEIARMYPSVQHNIACFRNRDGELPNAADETKDRGLLKVSALTVDGIDVVAQQKSAWIFNDGCQLGGALSNEIQTNFIPALESVKPFIDSSAFSSSARQTQESSSSLSSTAFQHSSFHSITSALRYAKHFFAQVLSTFTSSPSLQSIDAEEENNITLIFYGQNLIPCNIRYVMMSSKNGQLCNPLNFRSYINENQSVASVPSSWLVPSAINDVISASVVLVSLNDSSIVTFSTANVPVSSSNPTPNNKPKITPNQILAIAASCSAVAFIGLIVLLYIFLRRWSKKNALKTAYATEEMYNKENDHKSYSTFKDNYTGCDNSVSTNSSYLSISSQSYGNSSHSFASDTVIFSAQNRFISSYAKKKHKNKFRSRFSDKSSEEDEEVLYNLSVTIPYDVITPCYEE